MTVTEPLPGVYGKADWEDYQHYWREADAEWIQDRLVLRIVDEGGLADLDHTPGGLVYNADLDQLQLLSGSGSYKTLTPLPGTLTTAEAAGKTTIQHIDAGVGQGIVFSATEIEITDDFKVQGGVLTVNSTGVSIRTGAKTAKLTTDPTNLVSDTPISAPGVVITGGALTAAGRSATVGSLVVETTASVNGVLTANAANSVISGSTFRSGGLIEAPGGVVVSAGYFGGDTGGVIMRQRNATTQVLSPSYFSVDATNVYAGNPNGYFYCYPMMRVQGAARGIYHEGSTKWIAPSFYSPPTPDVNLYPEGTIWIS